MGVVQETAGEQTAGMTGPPSNRVGGSDRLDGWKSIGAHFGRDRTTVIRWARERGLPVYRLPGGRTGTVYAFRYELDRWAASAAEQEGQADPPADDPAGPAPVPARRPVRRVAAALVLVAIVALTMTVALWDRSAQPGRTTPAVPADPALATRFLTARDLAADRSAAGLEKAIALLQTVVDKEPGFAPAQAALGEALILSREFGRRTDGDAFARARIAARTALRLDPQSVAGHRLLGFIAYWRDGDLAEAKMRFRQALAIDNGDAMTHFWFGNILSDHGDHAAALAELDRARLLQPGSVAMRTDLAWARWMSGDAPAATRDLREIVSRHPDFAVAHDCLSVIALLEGRGADYADHYRTFARLRGDTRLLQRADDMSAAPPAMLHRVILRHALTDVAAGDRDRLWTVTIASLMQDRVTVTQLLRDAEARDEHWGGSGFVDRVRAIWRHDPTVLDLIDRRTRSKIV